jgi:hypothetical protein
VHIDSLVGGKAVPKEGARLVGNPGGLEGLETSSCMCIYKCKTEYSGGVSGH